MDEGLAALFGALIGGGTTWLTTWAIELRREQRTARALAVAAASELDAVLMLLQARGWRALFQEAHDSAVQAGDVYHVEIHAKEDYLPHCRAALSQAGSIDHELAIYLARILTLHDGLISDVQRLAKHPPSSPGSLLDSDRPETAVKIYNELLQIIDAGYELGGRAISRVHAVYPAKLPTWRGRLFAAWKVLRGA